MLGTGIEMRAMPYDCGATNMFHFVFVKVGLYTGNISIFNKIIHYKHVYNISLLGTGIEMRAMPYDCGATNMFHFVFVKVGLYTGNISIFNKIIHYKHVYNISLLGTGIEMRAMPYDCGATNMFHFVFVKVGLYTGNISIFNKIIHYKHVYNISLLGTGIEMRAMPYDCGATNMFHFVFVKVGLYTGNISIFNKIIHYKHVYNISLLGTGIEMRAMPYDCGATNMFHFVFVKVGLYTGNISIFNKIIHYKHVYNISLLGTGIEMRAMPYDCGATNMFHFVFVKVGLYTGNISIFNKIIHYKHVYNISLLGTGIEMRAMPYDCGATNMFHFVFVKVGLYTGNISIFNKIIHYKHVYNISLLGTGIEMRAMPYDCGATNMFHFVFVKVGLYTGNISIFNKIIHYKHVYNISLLGTGIEMRAMPYDCGATNMFHFVFVKVGLYTGNISIFNKIIHYKHVHFLL